MKLLPCKKCGRVPTVTMPRFHPILETCGTTRCGSVAVWVDSEPTRTKWNKANTPKKPRAARRSER